MLSHSQSLDNSSLSFIAADAERTLGALVALRHLWPANLLQAVKDLATQPQPEDPDDNLLQPVVDSFDRIMAIIRGQEADLGGAYSESANEMLEWLAVELDHRLKTGLWSNGNEVA